MLTIRREQMHVLGGGFAPRLAEYLREHDAQAASRHDDGALLRFIEAGVAAARAIGLTSEHDCARWIEILLVHGGTFGRTEATAWAAAMLEDAELAPSERLARIDARLAAEEDWQRRRAEAAAQRGGSHA